MLHHCSLCVRTTEDEVPERGFPNVGAASPNSRRAPEPFCALWLDRQRDGTTVVAFPVVGNREPPAPGPLLHVVVGGPISPPAGSHHSRRVGTYLSQRGPVLLRHQKQQRDTVAERERTTCQVDRPAGARSK
ncbi:hypothetical protein VTK73DRAFT_1765 [Phialemonium thermophilum]|uniref:Uncharacterized protein n=1 Tax=Phialemonium thermophilum TaxID=223376 RepID=A0ABR3VT07_9PEZI